MESLFVIQGKDQGYRFELLHDVVTLGRDPNNMIQLHDGEISRKHAEVRREAVGRTLCDLNSSNGLFVNGDRVQERRLVNGDQIQIGRTLLLYTCSNSGDDSAYSDAASVVFQTERNRPELSRIVHSLSQEEGRRLFQTASEKAFESAWVAKAKAHLNLMYHTTLVVSQTLDVDRLLHRIMDLIFEWVQVDRGCILLYNSEDNSLVPKVSRTRNRNIHIDRLSISQTILDYVLKRKEGVLTSDAQSDQRWEPAASIVHLGIREAICVPMQGRYGLVGVIYIDTSRSPHDLLTDDFASPPEETISSEAGVSELNATYASENTIDSGTRNIASNKGGSFRENGRPENGDAGTKAEKKPRASKMLTADHLKLMVAIGHQAALAVEDTQYYLGMVQAERLAAVGQTVAILSHHIKNILQGIRGGSYLIDLGLKEHDEVLVRKGWGIVEKNQTKISDLVLDMLTFSKERTPIWEEADLNGVVGDVVELMSGRSVDMEVALDWEPDAAIPRFFFDAEQIHRAITNLVTNAIDAARERFDDELDAKINETKSVSQTTRSASVDSIGLSGRNENDEPNRSNSDVGDEAIPSQKGRVRVRSVFNSRNSTASVVVDDNGPGVSPELKDVLFRPFLSKNKSSGTGLGLAVTNKIVHEHKGKVDVFESPLGGARFVVELPLLVEKPADEQD